MSQNVIIEKGSVLVYRIFDIAEEVRMDKTEALLKNSKGPDTFKVPKYIDRGIVMKSRPLTFGIGEVSLKLDCGVFSAEVYAKVRDYGVLTLIYQIALPEGFSWSQLVALASDLEEGWGIDEMAIPQAKQVAEQLKEALIKPSTWTSFEDYVVYFIEDFRNGISAKNLLEHADIPALLLAEDDAPLSKPTQKSILEHVYQYGENDLALVEWNSALVVEPGGGREVPDILEFAVTHLLEMRFYDDLLDSRLASLYDNIEKNKGHALRGNFGQLYQDASTRYIEFSEFIERAENSLKFVGDFYLATVYRAATKKFRLHDWQQNITRKMNLLAQVSSLLQGEVNMRRSHLMEITIILLIAFEVISAMLKLF